MDDAILTQLLALMDKLQKENSALKQRIEELSKKPESPIALSSLKEPVVSMDDYIMNLTRRGHELSNSKKDILNDKVKKAVDSVLLYANSVGFQ